MVLYYFQILVNPPMTDFNFLLKKELIINNTDNHIRTIILEYK